MTSGKAPLLRRLLIARTDRTEIELVRSAAVAPLGFWADFATLALLTEIVGLYYLVSASIAFIVGLSVNYGLSVIWIFKHRRIKSRIAEFTVFCMIGGVGAGVMLAAMWLFTEVVQLHYLLSKIVSSVFVFVVNFTMRKFLLFHPGTPREG